MGSPVFKIEGLKDLNHKLLALGTVKAEVVLRDAIRAGGEVVQAAVREAAPERPALPSGTALPPGALKADIELVVGRIRESGIVTAVVRPGKFTAYAANWVEYGHKIVKGGQLPWSNETRHRGGTGRVINSLFTNVDPHPFIRPAFESSRGEATRVAIEKLREDIEKVART